MSTVPFCDGFYRCVECNVLGRGGRGFTRARDMTRFCSNPSVHNRPDPNVPPGDDRFDTTIHPWELLEDGLIDPSALRPGNVHSHFCEYCEDALCGARRVACPSAHKHQPYVRPDIGKMAMLRVPTVVRETVGTIIHAPTMGAVPLERWVTGSSTANDIVRLECKHLPCGHLYKKRHAPGVGYTVIELDLRSGQVYMCCTARMCTHYRYPLLDKPVEITRLDLTDTECASPPTKKRQRVAKLVWCDGKHRCLECHPKGMKDRLTCKSCIDPEKHMISGLSRHGVMHAVKRDGTGVYSDEAEMRALVEDMESGMCGQCRSAFPKVEVHCPKTPYIPV